MIDVVYTIKVNPGKRNDAVELLRKIAALNKKLLPEMSCRVLTPTTGVSRRVFAVNTYDSHAQMEQHLEKCRATPEWDAIMKERGEKDIWVRGDNETNIYKVEQLV